MVKKLKSIFRKWKAKPEPEPPGIIALTDAEHAFLCDMIVHTPPPRGLPPGKRKDAQDLYLALYKKIVLGGVQK